LTRREFFNVCTKQNIRHLFGAVKGFHEGVEETRRTLSCDEAAAQLVKDRQKRLHQHKRKRKEG